MEKKKNSWHVSVIDGSHTGMRVVEKVLGLGGKKMNRSDDADHEVAMLSD